MKWLSHLRTVQHHRFLVLRHCWRVGLYWQGLTHDLSKFSPVEFSAGAKYYQGNRSPNEIERREKGYSAAWLLIRAGISIIWSTGSTTPPTAPVCAA